MMKKLLPLFILFALVSCGKTPETETHAETDAALDAASIESNPVLISLGDSIARGFGLADPKTEAYTAVLIENFAETGGVACNFGVDGQDSTELISYIAANPAIPEALSGADYVTISIGANNFLGDAFTFLSVYNDFKTNPSTAHTAESVTASFRQFNTDVSDGIDDLRSDIPEIIDAIRTQNDTCEILFLTCYNPYGAVNVTLDWGGAIPVNISALSDTCVTQMNDVITELADEYNYTVADVYTAFDGKTDRLVNAISVKSGDTFDPNGIDPHPNKTGHKVIADVLYEIIKN